jgi:hypothetical protein
MTTLGLLSTAPITTVPCIICLGEVSIDTATAGSLYADGQQAFACSSHLFERKNWINSWALFDYRQRQLQDLIVLAECPA